MPVVPAIELLRNALAGGYAVGYFEAWDMQSIESVLAAAEDESSPVILGFGLMTADPEWAAGRAIDYYAGLARAAGEASRVPVSLILNEVATLEQAMRGLDLGFGIAMLEGGASIEDQRELVRLAHGRGAIVEAEVGELPYEAAGVSGSLTDPAQAARFVTETGVDVLAVSVGNVHCGEEGGTRLDLDRLAAIREAVGVPLSLHGGSALPPECIPQAIALGVAKINVGTVLKQVYRDALVKACGSPVASGDVQRCIGSGGDDDVLSIAALAVRQKVRELICLYGSTGRAN